MKCFSKIFAKNLKLTQQHKDMKKIIKLTESDLQKIVNKIILESQEEEKFEKGKSGVRASRSKADFQPTPKESEIMKVLFGKYENDIPPIVVRYLRKMDRKTLTKRLLDLDMINIDMIKEK